MSERKRIFLLISIMALSALIVAGITIGILYHAAINEERERLLETVQSQARLIEAVARFDAIHNKSAVSGGAKAATLSQIIEAHQNYEQSGRTMEFTLAERKDDSIIFLLRHRHGNLDHELETVGFDSYLAEPMRQALLRRSGTIVGVDYRGELVLAAHEPVSELNSGIVAKIDLSEIRAPFIRAGGIAGFFAILAVIAGATLFVRISNPMIKQIERHNDNLSTANRNLKKEIAERKRAENTLQKTHNELELRVNERTADLSKSNTLLRQEIDVRKQAEEQLRHNETMLQKVFDGILDPLILIGKDMQIKIMNRASAQYFGIVDLEGTIGKICYRALKCKSESREGCKVPMAISNGQNITVERNKPTDPNRYEKIVIYPIEEDGGSIGSVIVRISDITERKLFERQLIQKEKMASLGVLVSSIAHEINNPNNFVSFNIPILRDYIKEMIPIIDEYAVEHPEFELCNLTYPEFRQDIFKLIVNIENGSGRISTFVSNLRDFSQNKNKKPLIWVELKDVIESVHSICHSKIKSSVKSFVKDIPENLPKIYTEPYALEQILLNLMINAAQAADKHDSWIKLNVTVSNGERGHIGIEVSDNGCGIDKEAQLKIFDPFFTTKSQLEGTGLGLYVCHTLVERLKGRIDLESEPGKGSVFRLILPVANQR
jgi:signal transduction histidine kinase